MQKKMSIHHMAIIAVMAAVISILGPLSIPIGVVPISFTNLAIYLSLYVIGMEKGTISYIIYLLIGFVGIPVFSNFTGGPSKIVGPTGGYLIGFIIMSLIAGFIIDKFIEQWYLCFVGMLLGTVVCYVIGTVWLSLVANLTIRAAISAGVIPFVPGDIIKILIAAFIGPQIRKRIMKANLL